MYNIKEIKRAKLYVDAMAQGINPLNGDYVNERDSLSEERIQTCMNCVSQVLSDIINGGKTRSRSKNAFVITPEQKARVVVSDESVGVNEIAKRINAAVDTSGMRTISGTKIAAWMVKHGYLDLVKTDDNKTIKALNARSADFGISERDKVNLDTGESYKQPVYNLRAQKYIIDHIEEINS